MNFTSVQKIRVRLLRIIDSVLVGLDPKANRVYGLDQCKLQQWSDLLKSLIVEKQKVIHSLSAKGQVKKKAERKVMLPRKFGKDINSEEQKKHRSQMVNQFQVSKLIEVNSGSRLTVHRHITGEAGKSKLEAQKFFQSKQYMFPQDTLKRFSTHNQIAPNKFLFSGGCLFSNPLIKSQSISVFNDHTGQIVKVGQLIQPLSSHSSVLVYPKVYFIGGKKGQGINTKMCSYFDLITKETVQIAALNYNSASACVVAFNQQYIYKIGGVGESFGQYSVSPYIQRYSIRQNFWEVINPFINQQRIQSFNQFQLYAHSGAYVAQNTIVVLGGFSFDRKGTSFGCILEVTVQEKSISSEGGKSDLCADGEDDVHQIREFGEVHGLEPGGFWNNQMIFAAAGESEVLLTLQTVMNPQPKTKIQKLILNEKMK